MLRFLHQGQLLGSIVYQREKQPGINTFLFAYAIPRSQPALTELLQYQSIYSYMLYKKFRVQKLCVTSIVKGIPIGG